MYQPSEFKEKEWNLIHEEKEFDSSKYRLEIVVVTNGYPQTLRGLYKIKNKYYTYIFLSPNKELLGQPC